MSNIYTTGIVSLICYPSQPQPNCVFQINWNLVGTDPTSTYYASVPGTTEAPYDSTDPYIPYNELTLSTVLGWVTEYTPADQIAAAQASIDASIEAQQNPPTVSPALPWNVPTPAPTPPSGPTGATPAPTTSSSAQS